MKNESYNKKNSFAKTISHLCEAPFLAIPTFLIINLVFNKENFFVIQIISLFFATILPIVTLGIWIKFKTIDRDFTIKEDRVYPFLMAIAIYFIGTFILWIFHANPLTTAVMLCYATNTLLVFIINFKWKISVHSIGVTGPTLALMFVNPWFFIIGLIGPLVMWSRLTLKKHTILQVLAGSLFGYIVTAIQLYYLIKLLNFNLNVDMYLISLIVIGLSLPPLFLFLRNYLNDKEIHGGYTRITFYFIALVSFIGFFIVSLISSSFIPIISLILSGIISIIIEYFLDKLD